MDNFTDYYAVLGINPNASTTNIKAAFKKLALQYHPDVYKGEDAQERMRLLLEAYQILNDPSERRTFDMRRSEHVLGTSPRGYVASDLGRSAGKRSRPGEEVSPAARRDRQRHYSFPDVSAELPLHLDLGDMVYDLSAAAVYTLKVRGLLRGIDRAVAELASATSAAESNYPLHCHRCHHRWTMASLRGRAQTQSCPSCNARDWAEYLLLRCTHCHAVFESEQIRDEVGTYNYGDGSLCPPYELFPLCPYCNAAAWCPAEDERVATLRAAAARKAALVRIVWTTVAIIAMIALGFLVLNIAH